MLTVGVFAATSQAQTAGLSGSAHDFTSASSVAWNASGEMCLPCHIPHPKTSGTLHYTAGVGVTDTNSKLLGAGLWNHQLSGLDSTPYSLYTSWVSTTVVASGVSSLPLGGKAAAATTITGNVDQNTKLCLGCHDGTVALASFNLPHGATAGANGTITMTTAASFAVKGANNDLTATHPIGDAARWSYPTDTTKFVDPSTHATSGIVPLRPMADGGMAVGCSSCHDPHNTAGNDHFLWVNNRVAGTTDDGRHVSGSLLCENCHVK
jgi:hypothetical protein